MFEQCFYLFRNAYGELKYTANMGALSIRRFARLFPHSTSPDIIGYVFRLFLFSPTYDVLHYIPFITNLSIVSDGGPDERAELIFWTLTKKDTLSLRDIKRAAKKISNLLISEGLEEKGYRQKMQKLVLEGFGKKSPNVRYTLDEFRKKVKGIPEILEDFFGLFRFILRYTVERVKPSRVIYLCHIFLTQRECSESISQQKFVLFTPKRRISTQEICKD